MNSSPTRSSERTLVAVVTCFVLSGFAALLYQTVWMRQFSLVFGTSELAIATVLAAYMGGLALGASVAGRRIKNIDNPVLFYGLLELGVAVGALLVPAGLWLVQKLHVSILGGQAQIPDSGGIGESLFYLLFGFLIIALPTAFMGATLPVLTRHVVHTQAQIGQRTGLLYAMNTAGAVVGTLACAFLILPRAGLFGTTLVGVGINAIIFLVAIRLVPSDKTHKVAPAPTADLSSADPVRAFHGCGWILPLILMSGAASFAYEVLWTRLLAHILGTSLYSFATMLATFLTGITLGSALASRLATQVTSAARGFCIAQLGTGLSALVIFKMLDKVPGIADSLSAGEQAGLLGNAFVASMVLLPTTLFIGATFPFAVRLLARTPSEAAKGSARIYSWNTVGAILGSAATGFFLIPHLQFTGTLLAAVILNGALALVTAWKFLPAPRNYLLTGVGALAVGLLVLFPTRPDPLLRMSPVRGNNIGDIVYCEVGASATVLLLEHEGIYYLRTNGLPEALIAPKGTLPLSQQGNWWLGALPPLVRPDAKSMLVIGFGGGVVIEGIPNSIEQIDVIELEPKVIEANRVIGDLRHKNPLADPRIRIVTNDARGALALTDRRYDIIMSQPSHPWTAGASHLYTREFMKQVEAHLTPAGVFCQGYLDESILAPVAATLTDTFSHVRLYHPGTYLYLASNEPIDLVSPTARCAEVIDNDPDLYSWLGVHRRQDLVASVVLQADGIAALAATAGVITDDHNLLATAPPHLIENSAPSGKRDALFDQYDPLVGADNLIEYCGAKPTRVVQQLSTIGFTQRAQRVADALQDPLQRALSQLLLCPPSEPQRFQQLLQEADRLGSRQPETIFKKQQQRVSQGLVLEELAALPPVARASLEAAEIYLSMFKPQQASRWQEIANLEPLLAAARSDEVWFELANSMRALWRINLSSGSPQEHQTRAEQALDIIDRVIAIYPKDSNYTVRLSAAAVAKRPFVVLETARELAKFLARVPMDKARRNSLANQTLQTLQQASEGGAIPPQRSAPVIKPLQAILRLP